MNIFSVNFSLRTRESHLVGTKTIENGEINFVEGILVKSMKEGGILYLDELNAAEPDMLLRLDEALDDRRQIILKEAEGQIIKASEGWFVVATINPLSHVGTKELPPQLLSRFPIRLSLDYPPEETELEIIKSSGHSPLTPSPPKYPNNIRSLCIASFLTPNSLCARLVLTKELPLEIISGSRELY